MHAVIINVTIKDPEVAVTGLREQVVPETKQAPGFVAGYWLRKDNSGLAVILMESEEAATNLSQQVTRPEEAVTIDGVEVREVVAHA